jgi:enamine deaminase RidA (YjgF/YER057c/UK114 family)
MTRKRQSVSSGTAWEAMAGYCRAVRVDDRILVAGTTATGPDGLVGGDDPAAQARYALDKIEAAITQLGGRLEDVVRTRVYVSDIAHWEAVARVHGERFGHIRPVNTLVEARLVGPEYLVEIEVEAIVGAGERMM